MRIRDTWRARVYRAENAAFACYDQAPRMSWPEVERFVAKVCKAEKRNAPRLGHGQGAKRPIAFSNRIVLPKFARKRVIILHELAHYFTPPPASWHGEDWAGMYFYLISKYIGETEAKVMSMAFNQFGVYGKT